MSMSIQLMYNNKPSIAVNKSPVTIAELSGTLKDPTSIIKPTITIEYASPTGFNYCYIPAFNRYYFIDDIVVKRTNLLEIYCRCDVLYSWKNDILNQEALVKRNAEYWNLYINDGNFISYSNTKLVTKEFPGQFNGSSYILATMNGL